MNVTVYSNAGETITVIDTAAPPPSAAICTLGLVFGATGLLPFAFGQPFKRGDVPAGAQVVADCASFQCVPWAWFDDGSVRFAHVAGYVNVAAAGRVAVKLSLGTPASTSPFTPAPESMQVTIDGIAAPVSARTTIAQGPVMLHERVVRKIDAQLSVVYDVRRFKNGEVEIRVPRLCNDGFATAGTARTIAVIISINGATTFAETVTVKHNTWPGALRGAAWSNWIGGDKTLYPDHDRAYLCACESVPPYSVAPNAVLAAVPVTYYPNYIGEAGNTMGAPGYSPHIGLNPRHSVYPLTVGGRIAWDYMNAEALAAGSWPIHFRDELTGALPLPSSYPNKTYQDASIPKGTGGEWSSGPVDTSHQPSWTFVAAALTGWSDLIEEHQAWTLWNHYYQWNTIRQQANGILHSDAGTNQDRGAAWGLRTLAQAIAISPAGQLLADFKVMWQSNMRYYAQRYVEGTLDGGRYVTPMGIIAPYSSIGTSPYTGADRGTSTMWWGSAWMQSFITQVLGHAQQMALPVTAQAQADVRAVFLQSAKLVVGLCGDGSAWNWRRFGLYAMPFLGDGNKHTDDPTNPWLTFTEAYAEYLKAKSLTALNPAPGGTLKKHSSDIDVTRGGWMPGNKSFEGDWSTGFLSYPWPALCYAVMHKAPGADAALARVMSSASWPLIAPSINEPEWTGMMPPGYKHPGTP